MSFQTDKKIFIRKKKKKKKQFKRQIITFVVVTLNAGLVEVPETAPLIGTETTHLFHRLPNETQIKQNSSR
jgi:hypothetical protein